MLKQVENTQPLDKVSLLLGNLVHKSFLAWCQTLKSVIMSQGAPFVTIDYSFISVSQLQFLSSPQYTIHLQESAASDGILEAQKSCNTCIMVSIKILACWQILLVFLIHPSPQVVCFSKMVSLASAATTVSRNQTSSRKKSKEGKKHAREGEVICNFHYDPCLLFTSLYIIL